MALYSVKITITADNTAQAPTEAQLVAAGVSTSKRKASWIVVYSEASNNAAAVSRYGGVQVHRGNSIGLPIRPDDSALVPITAGGRNSNDVCTTYVSAKANDVFNYTWLVE